MLCLFPFWATLKHFEREYIDFYLRLHFILFTESEAEEEMNISRPAVERCEQQYGKILPLNDRSEFNSVSELAEA